MADLAGGRERRVLGGRLVLGGPPHPCVNTIRVEFQEQPEALPEADHAAWLTAHARTRPVDRQSVRQNV